MAIDIQALSAFVAEANVLTSKERLTRQEETRFAFLQTAIAAVKAGASVQDVQLAQLNEIEERNGMRRTTLGNGTPLEVRAKSAFLKKMFSDITTHAKFVPKLKARQCSHRLAPTRRSAISYRRVSASRFLGQWDSTTRCLTTTLAQSSTAATRSPIQSLCSTI